MSRKQELIAAFSAAVRELGVENVKQATFFGSGLKQQEEQQTVSKAA